jgi:cytochrome c
MNIEQNKLFAAVLLAGIVAMLAGFVAEVATHPHELEEDAVFVDGGDVATASVVEKKAEPILAMIATADIERGAKLSKACAACHSFDKGGKNGVGPNMWNVVGIKKQSHEGYNYSGALNVQGVENWTYLALNKFLWKPKEYAPGTKMNYIGLKKPEDRAAIIAWLRTLSDSPEPLPTEAEIATEMAELAPPEPEVTEEATEEAIEDSLDETEAASQKADEVLESDNTNNDALVPAE